ncbi:hypothetical protein B0T26DRAFT_164440 [Lasiosphaeria miniovina]|uniref:Rhomboid family membrane protein n=1 Tax=Lasiosphaeria miniovina TaxID=1954250 RepID=A0AA40B6K5_9PEZI|nr:uncharacterized protein B0T26DRAFT_164440 [Lasiosphaeria miniovina]KAK0728228.1 hypothetical protein B0T26DRAFT_164440 [Lasiosphaeria miniovina]
MAPESAPPPPPPPEPPASTATTTAVDKWYGTPPLVHYASLVAAVLAPVGLLLPGRGRGALSVQNAVLGAGAFWSLNQVAYDYSGKSIYARSNERWAGVLNAHALPEKARANRELMERERERRRHLAGAGKGGQVVQVPQQQEQVRESDHGTEEDREREKLLPEWKRQRLEEEREALKEGGKGISGMITDQIWEVWNQGLAAGLRGAGGGAGGGSDEKTKTKKEEQTQGGKGEKGE